MSEASHHWWQTGVIYEVYVRSFQDSDGDGVGDLKGLHRRLDYLQWLGVDILWLTPIYPSPMVEFGYDIADYTGVEPAFGSLADFDALLADAHRRGMHLVLDIAPNHTSDRHAWFTESRSSRTSPKADWYLWRDPGPDGGPPNNWLSAFGGQSAWEFEPRRGQYYYHAFMKEQPDLNWRNPEVERAVFDALRFWLKRGVDGFRIDVIWHLLKDAEFRDNPPNADYDPKSMPSNDSQLALYNTDRPEVVDIVERMRNVLREFGEDRLMIGELYHSPERLVRFYGDSAGGAQMPHNQMLVLLPWSAGALRNAIEKYLAAIPDDCWPNWVLSNHDKPRIATRVGRPAQARVARMLLCTLFGTPTLYYGDELGMENTPIPPSKLRDPFEKLDPGRGQGRDGQRTPMPWQPNAPNAGFSEGEPWLPLGEDWREVNVEVQRGRPESMLHLTRELLRLRRSERAFTLGRHRLVLNDGPVLAYRREHETGSFLVVLNLSRDFATLGAPRGWKLRPVLSTRGLDGPREIRGTIELRPDEGLILRRE